MLKIKPVNKRMKQNLVDELLLQKALREGKKTSNGSCRTCAASRRSPSTLLWTCVSGKYGETREFLSLISVKWNGSRHLVFWSLGTLTGLRDRVRRLVA